MTYLFIFLIVWSTGLYFCFFQPLLIENKRLQKKLRALNSQKRLIFGDRRLLKK